MRRAKLLIVWSALASLVGCAYLPSVYRPPAYWPFRPAPLEHPPLVSTPPIDLPAPEGLRATSGEYRSIPLQWDPLLSIDVGGYRIERAQRREGPYVPLLVIWDRGFIARLDRGGAKPLGDGVTRFYRIRAFSPEGRLSVNASEVVVGTTAPLPEPPKGLRAYSRQPREVPLSWHAAEDPSVAGYVIERSPSPDGPFEVIANAEERHATSHVDKGLGDLRVFYYRIATLNPGGIPGAPSDPVRAVTKPKPLPPMGLRVGSQRLGVNVLAWSPNVETDLEEYRLYRVSQGSAPEFIASVPASRTQAEDLDVPSSATVSYLLMAVDREGLESRPSQRVEAEGVSYGLRAEARSGEVVLHWNPRREEGFVRARVERDGWLGRRALGTSDTGLFVDRDVRPGSIYRYLAVLERAEGKEAPPSLPVDVRVPDPRDFR